MNRSHRTTKFFAGALVTLIGAIACATKSGGGSNTSWVVCKVNTDCPASMACVAERCASPSDGDPADGGGAPPLGGVSDLCVLNSDCEEPLVCIARRCSVSCVQARDCPAGQRCVQYEHDAGRACELLEEAHCARNSDCIAPLVCAADLQCRNECKETRDCREGQTCTAGGSCL